jgi:hypothetical protein
MTEYGKHGSHRVGFPLFPHSVENHLQPDRISFWNIANAEIHTLTY